MNRNFEDDYILGRKIGEGSFSEVYECSNKISKRINVVKIIKPSKSKYNKQREADILKNLQYKTFPKYYSSYHSERNDEYFLVMEKCEGVQLNKYIYEYKCIPEHCALTILHQLAKALSYIHRHNYAHLDLKSTNIMINTLTLTIKVLDFGFATDCVNDCTEFNGSLPYTAPELLKRKPFDARKADIWALGIIFYELLYGQLPWSEKALSDPKTLVNEITFKEIDYSSKPLSPRAKEIFENTLTRNPKERADADTIVRLFGINKKPRCLSSLGNITAPLITKPRINKARSLTKEVLFRV